MGRSHPRPGTFGERPAPGALGMGDLGVVAAPDRLHLVPPVHGGREVAAGTFRILNTGMLAPPLRTVYDTTPSQ
ncbi:hypothetical protein ACWDZ4_13625 [Streptomyces sp. NPDC003016]